MIRILLLVLVLSGCVRAPLHDPKDAFHFGSTPEKIIDSYSPQSLRDAIDRTLRARFPESFEFSGRKVSGKDYRRSLEALKAVGDRELEKFLRDNFDFYEVYGNERFGQVLSTGYYVPEVEGRKTAEGPFTRALYRTPQDLVTIDLRAFLEKYPELESLQRALKEKKIRSTAWVGRLQNRKVSPYYQRQEIDSQKNLKGQQLELCYLRPVDAFFLEIQGSGVVRFANGEKLKVGFAAQNGYPYQPIGKYLLDVIPKDKMSMQKIREHLASLSETQRQEILNKNPSYVFFQELKGEALTFSGAEATAGRTIATDKVFFPKGLLGYLEIEEPVFTGEDAQEPSSWESRPRLVLDQDTGGAIQGGGRIDLFYGTGEDAGRRAGVMKKTGRLWYLVPKDSFLNQLIGKR